MSHFLNVGKTRVWKGDPRQSDCNNYVMLGDIQTEKLKSYIHGFHDRFQKLAKQWVNQDVHVLGCGPSVMNWVSAGRPRPCIGVNGIFKVEERPDFWLMVDPIHSARPLNDAARKYCMDHPEVPKLTFELSYASHWYNSIMDGFKWAPYGLFLQALEPNDNIKNGLYFKHSSVHAAADLARLMGARTIWVWGVDMNDRSHVYTPGKESDKTKIIADDPKDNPGVAWNDIGLHEDGWAKIVKFCEYKGTKIFNCNPGSAIGSIPKVSFSTSGQAVHGTGTYKKFIGNVPLFDWESNLVTPKFAPNVEVKEVKTQSSSIVQNVEIKAPSEVKTQSSSIVQNVEIKAPSEVQIDFFTFGTQGEYYDMAFKMSQELAMRGVNCAPLVLNNEGDWMKNCMQRCKYLLEFSKQCTEPWGLGLLDSDLEFRKDPVIFSMKYSVPFINDCIMVKVKEGIANQEFTAGTVIFFSTDKGKALLRRWVELCEQDPVPNDKLREQLYLGMAYYEVQPRAMMLGRSYCFVPPKRTNNYVVPDDTVIVHLPASRRLKKGINNSKPKSSNKKKKDKPIDIFAEEKAKLEVQKESKPDIASVLNKVFEES